MIAPAMRVPRSAANHVGGRAVTAEFGVCGSVPWSDLYGSVLEHQVFLELRAYLDYRRLDHELTFWRTHSGYEVDFLVGDSVAIEVKASRHVSAADLRGLRAYSEEKKLQKRIVVCTEPGERATDDGIAIMPVDTFFKALWNDALI